MFFCFGLIDKGLARRGRPDLAARKSANLDSGVICAKIASNITSPEARTTIMNSKSLTWTRRSADQFEATLGEKAAHVRFLDGEFGWVVNIVAVKAAASTLNVDLYHAETEISVGHRTAKGAMRVAARKIGSTSIDGSLGELARLEREAKATGSIEARFPAPDWKIYDWQLGQIELVHKPSGKEFQLKAGGGEKEIRMSKPGDELSAFYRNGGTVYATRDAALDAIEQAVRS